MEEKLLKILHSLVPEFINAGKLALSMQETVKSTNKLATGNPEIDIVTEADEKVQEYILQKMTRTDLVQCRLLAEEDTPAVSEFKASDSKYKLTLDPIDGTRIYADRYKFFSIIVGLHTDEKLLYWFQYFPAMDWSHEMIKGKYFQTGNPSKIRINKPINTSKVIAYIWGDPKKTLGKLYDDLICEGYQFINKQDLTKEAGSTAMMFSGLTAGVFYENPLAIDCMGALQYAKINGLTVYHKAKDMSAPFSELKQHEDSKSFYYPGYFLAFR